MHCLLQEVKTILVMLLPQLRCEIPISIHTHGTLLYWGELLALSILTNANTWKIRNPTHSDSFNEVLV